jgi:5-methylcytosine-specific restriction protein A
MAKLKTLKSSLPTLRTGLVREMVAPKPEIRDRGRPWMRKRERILMRDCGVCQCIDCKAGGHVRLATEVDHEVPRWKWLHMNGTLDGCEDDCNLRAMNADCHRKKTSAEERERRALGL